MLIQSIQNIGLCLILSVPILAFGEESDNINLESRLKSADSLFNNRQYDASREIYLNIAESADKAGNNSILTEAYSMVARTFLITAKKEEGRPWIAKASTIVKKSEPLGWSRYLGVRGRFEWQDGKLDTAEATFKEMYDFCHDNSLFERAIDAAHMVAITADNNGQIEWGLKGIREAEAGQIDRWLGPLWNNLAATYEDSGRLKESLEAYLKARGYHYKFSDPKSKLIADWAVGHSYRINGDLKNAEIFINDSLLTRFGSLGETEFEGWTLKELGELALAKSKAETALAYLVRGAEKLKAVDMPNWDPDGFQKLQEQIDSLQTAKTK